MMFDTKTNFLSFVDPKLWPFKSWRYQKISKFWNAHNTPPRGPRAEKFWFSKFLPRGYLHAKNDQNRWDKGVKLLWSPLEWAHFFVGQHSLSTSYQAAVHSNSKIRKSYHMSSHITHHHAELNFQDRFLTIIALPKPDDGEGLASVAFGVVFHLFRGSEAMQSRKPHESLRFLRWGKRG